MATNRGVAYVATGKVEIRSIDFPKLELGNRKCEHGVILKISDPVVLRHLRAVKTKSDLDDSFWQVSKLGA